MKTIKKDSMIWKSFSFWNMLLNQKPEAPQTYCGFIILYIFTVVFTTLMLLGTATAACAFLYITYLYATGVLTLSYYITFSSPVLVILVMVGFSSFDRFWSKIQARCTPLRIE